MLKNVIFDVGDVLIEYRWKDMLMEYGLQETDAVRVGNEMFDNPLWYQELDMGLTTQEQVIEAYGRQFPEDAEVIAWFIDHGEYMHVGRPEVWKKVRRLKEKGYRIYLLSNYSEELFEKHTKDTDFINVIDGKVVSYQVHVTKPDARIYKCLLERYQLLPEECLFFDDRMDNVEAAQALGIPAVHVESRDMLNRCLEQLLTDSE